MHELGLIEQGGVVRASSRAVAERFGKRHTEVLRAIRNLDCPGDFKRRNFASFKTNDLTGVSTSHVDMTRDGFTFLAMGFTGRRAAEWKVRYIEAFNAMEAALSTPPADAKTWVEIIKEARMIGGRGAARAIWERSPLPALPPVHVTKPRWIELLEAATHNADVIRLPDIDLGSSRPGHGALSAEMKRLGFESRRLWEGAQRVRRWVRV